MGQMEWPAPYSPTNFASFLTFTMWNFYNQPHMDQDVNNWTLVVWIPIFDPKTRMEDNPILADEGFDMLGAPGHLLCCLHQALPACSLLQALRPLSSCLRRFPVFSATSAGLCWPTTPPSPCRSALTNISLLPSTSQARPAKRSQLPPTTSQPQPADCSLLPPTTSRPQPADRYLLPSASLPQPANRSLLPPPTGRPQPANRSLPPSTS
ncbi:hypothetical protein PCANC_27375 [Puccinia coronata f. sp. avenae]|uniref:Tet-like 2OG-Fe(II) oxygenase domain-containing protein n=1 Tax=Puccinia coronata f. sp. avenae TaxID=200324 RepID=A0A2N5TVD5_9BASI|nr:hypothetical protein PCANC_27375 [Puccinia coronata f. sp. avenae]